MRRRWSDDDLREAVRRAFSVYEVFRLLGLKVGGGQHLKIKNHIKDLNLDTTHFTGQRWNRGKSTGQRPVNKRTLEDILVESSTHGNTSSLKRRLVREGLLVDQCAVCGMLPVWQGKPLVLRLDHINGIRNDNRIRNLRAICPNCDSQTPTFSGRNKGRGDRPPLSASGGLDPSVRRGSLGGMSSQP